jgi:hypothetical protein
MNTTKLGVSFQSRDEIASQSLPWRFTTKSTVRDTVKQMSKANRKHTSEWNESYGLYNSATDSWLPMDTPLSQFQFSKGVKNIFFLKLKN